MEGISIVDIQIPQLMQERKVFVEACLIYKHATCTPAVGTDNNKAIARQFGG